MNGGRWLIIDADNVTLKALEIRAENLLRINERIVAERGGLPDVDSALYDPVF